MIARKSFLVFLNMMAGSVLGYVALFFILRYMGPEEYGIIGFGMAFVGLFAFIADLGFNHAHIKRVSEGRDLGSCIGTFFVVKVVLTAVMIGCVLFSIFFWKVVIGRGFETPEHEPVIYLFILFYVITSLSSIPLTTFAARRETAKQQLPGLIEPMTRAPLIIIIALGTFGVFALAGAYVAGVIAILITAIILFRGYPIGKFDPKLFKHYFRFAIPIVVAASIAMISVNIDKVMLQLFWGSRFVGYYFGAQRLTAFLVMISTAVTLLLFPTLSEHHGKGEEKEIRRLTIVAERYVSLIIMPATILFIVFAKPILFLFNAEIAENATTTLQIMSIYSLVFSFDLLFFNQIMAVDRPGLSTKIAVVMAVTNIVLNAFFIPKDIRFLGINLLGMGAEGAALATAISAIVGLILLKIVTRRLTGTKWNPKILMHLVAALVMGIVLFFISDTFNIWDLFDPFWAGIIDLLLYMGVLLCMGLLGIGIYLGILIIFKEFKKADLKLFLNILDPRGIKDYVIVELKDNKIE
ncbi:MAG: flippase [Thermoplasmata archaeon]|nr:MAG: flippase [Thermoplasmata archaeon]